MPHEHTLNGSVLWVTDEDDRGHEEISDICEEFTIRWCENDEDYPIEITGKEMDGSDLGLALSPVDVLKCYAIMGQFLKSIL